MGGERKEELRGVERKEEEEKGGWGEELRGSGRELEGEEKEGVVGKNEKGRGLIGRWWVER